MINQIFSQLLIMSYTTSYVIFIILIARIMLQKAPKFFSYALWSVALFRLLCPWSFESAMSLLTIRESTTGSLGTFSRQHIMMEKISDITILSKDTAIPTNVFNGISELTMWNIVVCIWIVGIAALLVYNITALLRLKKQLSNSVHDTENIYISKSLSTPFVMGVIRPKIYLPEFLTETEKQYILLHEQTHIRRLDHIIKLMSFIVLCMHWFNPLVWLAFFLSDKDREMSCDEAVIKQMGNDVKKQYSASLLSLATGRRIVSSTPLAFSEGGAKSRIKNILSYKRPNFWVTTVSLIIIIIVCVGLVSNPLSAKESSDVNALEKMLPLDQEDDSYKILGKSNQEENFLFSCASTSYQPEDVLTERMGFQVYFPDLLNGEYVCLYNSEGIGINKPVSLVDWQEMVPNVQKSIDDETAYRNLKDYEPYRIVAGYYGYPADERGYARGLIAITMKSENDSVQNYKTIGETKIKVGDINAEWLEIVSPNYVENSFLLTWKANGIQYELTCIDQGMKITMEDAVKLAESFMAKQ